MGRLLTALALVAGASAFGMWGPALSPPARPLVARGPGAEPRMMAEVAATPPTPAQHSSSAGAAAEDGQLQPNKLQAEAIRSTSNSVLLLASPGTGKTRVLRARMAHLLLSRGVPSSSILAVTFTQHAAQQLRLRVGALAGDTMDGVWLGTFHSICGRMVRELSLIHI